MTPLRSLAWGSLSLVALLCPRLARAADPLEIVADDGRSWDTILHEIENDPQTAGRTYQLTLVVSGVAQACSDYRLVLDGAARDAFVLEGCDPQTGATTLRLASRDALFGPGDVVPQPRRVAIVAMLTRSVEARGGDTEPARGSKIWCSVALQPYLWDGLHGQAVPLSPDRFRLHPLEEHLEAAPDGSGWIVKGESRMSVTFRYEVIDLATGKKVMENEARLACDDRAVSSPTSPPSPASTPPAPETSGAIDLPSPAAQPDQAAPSEAGNNRPFTFDARTLAAGAVLGTSQVQRQLTSLQLGLAKRVTAGWALGVSGSIALQLGGGDDGPTVTGLWQAGPELRYYPNGDDASGFDFWLGMRGGVEGLTAGGANGSFGEATLGLGGRTGSIDQDAIVAMGLGIDPPGMYGDASTLHPYVNLGYRFAIDM